MRSSTSDIAIKIDAPAVLALDQMMDYINEDELLEVTPTSLRMRKKILDFKERKRAVMGHAPRVFVDRSGDVY
jgi:GTP-binding protein